MDAIYYVTGLLVMVIIAALTLGVMKPSWAGWAYKLFKKSPASLTRKFIIATTLPALLVSGTVLGATEPASIKAERAAREQAAITAQQEAEKIEIAKKHAETKLLEAQKRAAETARQKAEAERNAAEEKKKLAEAEKQKTEAAAKAAADAQAQAQAQQSQPARVSTPTPASQPVRTYSAPAAPAPAPPNTVHAGAYCSSAGATGVFSSGNPAICAIDSKGARLRWQSP